MTKKTTLTITLDVKEDQLKDYEITFAPCFIEEDNDKIMFFLQEAVTKYNREINPCKICQKK